MLFENDFNKIKRIGFQVKAHERDGINGIKKKIIMETVPTIDDLINLFQILKNKYTINFWDAFHKQISDPGAYCTGVVLNNEIVSYMEGNHGWSSNWEEIDIINFAKFTQENWKKDIDYGEYFNCIIIEDNKYNYPSVTSLDGKLN